MKRLFDVFISTICLILLAPVLIAIWGIIVARNGLPGLFKQQRNGQNSRTFILLKFRTMSILPDAERGSFDIGSRSRVTPFGRCLRKWKIDELPQLWNVLKGDMSLVGPRPEVSKWVNEYPERWAKVLTVRPGITDPASIEFRNEETILSQSEDPERTYRYDILPKKLDLYEQYVDNHTFVGDLLIMLKTVWVVLAKRTDD